MKKVLFCDVDGTLMIHHPNGNIIPEGVKEELKRLKELGYDLFIASGRPMFYAMVHMLNSMGKTFMNIQFLMKKLFHLWNFWNQ